MTIEFSSEVTVTPRKSLASDDAVVEAMLVSTKGEESMDAVATMGRINFLMKNRHGTPFEQTFFKFFIDAPIFVFREFHRHRIGFGYNEESGRYKVLRGKFYVPPAHRKLQQVGKPGEYHYVTGTDAQVRAVRGAIEYVCRTAYEQYEYLLAQGVAKEVARMCLPVNTYSSMFVVCNARSMMAFLSLRQERTKREPRIDYLSVDDAYHFDLVWDGEAVFPSTPMWEINQVANKMELAFKEMMPLTHQAFVDNGYVAP